MRIKTVHVARTRIDFVRSERFQPQLYAVLTSPVPKMRWAWDCVPSMACAADRDPLVTLSNSSRFLIA
jgi:hypothetical protein